MGEGGVRAPEAAGPLQLLGSLGGGSVMWLPESPAQVTVCWPSGMCSEPSGECKSGHGLVAPPPPPTAPVPNCRFFSQDRFSGVRRYGHHVRRVPMIASRLDGPSLHKGLSRMKPSALRLNGWSLADLPLPTRQTAGLAGGPPAGGGAPGPMADPFGRGLHGPHPQGRPTRAPEHTPAHGPLHGLPTMGGRALGGRLCVAGVLGPSGGLWFPPRQKRPGWGGGDTGPLGAMSPPRMGRRGDEH